MTPDRAVVQGEHGAVYRPAGTIAWHEHEEAWNEYRSRFRSDQSALTIHERGGFGYYELTTLLGHEPTTWRPR